ncbi:MAG: response regulator [Desulfobacteraceae bacterium]|nr:response regulator [Desulfobacteraceae bacterium]
MVEKIKVLMVDDEEQFRVTTSKILTRRGFETTMAGSGEEAIEVLENSRHDVVILDIKMPGMDGHEALEKIKTIDPDVQVIMLTGHGTVESARESLNKEAFDYLNKPCDIDLLDSRIKEAYSARYKGVREEKRARDIMIPIEDYTTIDADSTIKEGIERLKRSFESFSSTSRIMETGHRSIVVFDRKGEMVGILSLRDLIKSLRPSYLSAPKPSMADSIEYSPMFWDGLFTHQAKGLVNKRIRDVMSGAPICIDEDTNLMEIANLIYSKQVRRMAVTRKGKVVGMVREQEIFFEIARIILES